MTNASLAPMACPARTDGSQGHDDAELDMPLADYKRWVDAMVSRPESLRKAREHAPGKTLKRKSAR